MKTLFSIFGGAVSIQEKAGDFYFVFDGGLGGGAAAGLVTGQGSVKLGTGSVGLKLAESWINSHVPSELEAFAVAAEGYLNSTIASQ